MITSDDINVNDEVDVLDPYKNVNTNPELIDTFTDAVDLICIICPSGYSYGIVKVWEAVEPEKITNNVEFTDKENVADAVYVAYVSPEDEIQFVPVPVDDKTCPAVPTSPEASVNVDCNVTFEVNVSDPCDVG